jgi:hypothetical protein
VQCSHWLVFVICVGVWMHSVSLASDESVCSSAGYVLFYMRKDRAEGHFTAPATDMET